MTKGFPRGDPSLEHPSEHYDKIYTRAEPSSWTAQRARTVTWYPALLLAEPPIIDIGCGAGHLAQMCDVFDIPYVLGVDYSAKAIQLARQNAPSAQFMTADAAEGKTIFGSEDYRTAVFLEVLEHIHDDLGLLRQIPSGRVVVGSVPSFYTDGHVRWFANERQVWQRYKNVLQIERVVTERAVNGTNQWFIFKGVRP